MSASLMKNILLAVVLFSLIICPTLPSFAADKSISDDEVRQLIIKESIASYPGNCPCPYNTARNGSRCGKRSAYSRAGGYSPLCYPSDVTDKVVEDYRQQYGYTKGSK